MMKKMIPILILILGMMCLFVFVEASSRDEAIKAAPITIYVDDNFTDEPENHKWDTIREGIDDANESDMVYVYSGTYHESILINKTISLIGEDRDTTVIDGVEWIREVVRVEANWVNISGFTLKSRQKGILLDSASNNSITNCTLSHNEYGIYAQGSSKNKITNCNISNNSIYGIQFELSSNNNSIYHNNFIDNINLNHAYDSSSNYWDNGYPSGGNYWSGWIGIADSNHGENQDMPGSDGVYDGPFNIPGGSNQDRYPLTHSFFWWDKTSPEISIVSLANGPIIKPGTTIDFEIDDENLNVVRCSVNEEGYEPFTSPYDFDTTDWDDGIYNITIYANDYGRNEIYESFTFTIDGTQPGISLISPKNNSVIKPETIIDFEINDIHLNLTTYTLDDTQPETLSSPHNISTKAWNDGGHNITVYANDFAGNEKTEKFTFIIDGTSPHINITGVANGSYYNTNVTIFVNISDAHLNAAENNITLDNISFISGTTVSSEGEHVLYIYGIDTVGNIAQETITFTIDKTKPNITVTGVTDGAYYNINVTPVIDISDANLNTTFITLNDNPFTSGNTISVEDDYILVVQVNDKAGNSANKTISFVIDKTPPTITITESSQTTNKNSFTMSWSSSEYIQYYEISADGVNWVNVSTEIYHTFTLSKGENTLYVRGTDFAGNTGTADMITVTYQEKKEEVPDYLIYLITIPIVFVVVLIVVIAFLKRKIKKRKIKIRCPTCKTVFDVKSGKRPLKTKCPKCGVEGILR